MTSARIVAVCILLSGVASAAPFKRGDVNQDGEWNIADPVQALSYLFAGGTTTCKDAIDANDDGATDIADPIWLLTFLFARGPAPKAPYPGCGEDAAGDSLTCLSFNDDVCPPPPTVTVTGCSPASGLVTGGTVVSISGSGFSGADPGAYLCDVALVGVHVVSDTVIEATTPAMASPRTCDLRVSNSLGSATLAQAFTYEPEPPPDCYTDAELKALIAAQLGVPICLPSPAWEGDVLFWHVVACPTDRAGTCEDGSKGCEATMHSIAPVIDYDTGKAQADISGSSALPVDFGTSDCTANIAMGATASMDVIMEATQWEGIRRIVGVQNLDILVTDFSLDPTGGGVCGSLSLGESTMRDTLQQELDARAPEFEAQIEEALVGQYVCP